MEGEEARMSEEYIGPTEEQVMDWNIHNDHAEDAPEREIPEALGPKMTGDELLRAVHEVVTEYVGEVEHEGDEVGLGDFFLYALIAKGYDKWDFVKELITREMVEKIVHDVAETSYVPVADRLTAQEIADIRADAIREVRVGDIPMGD
jgi:hypothetical protein